MLAILANIYVHEKTRSPNMSDSSVTESMQTHGGHPHQGKHAWRVQKKNKKKKVGFPGFFHSVQQQTWTFHFN